MAIKPGPKPHTSHGKLDRRRHDNKSTPKNYKTLKPEKKRKGK